MVLIHQLLLGVGNLSLFEKILVLEQSLLQIIVYLLSLLVKISVFLLKFEAPTVRMFMTLLA